jgi:hypothetical protein
MHDGAAAVAGLEARRVQARRSLPVMTSADGLIVRAMTRAELDIPLQWAADEGWNPGVDDADPFHAADPSGFLMAFLDGEPIGSISVVKYGDTFGFLGLYIVKAAVRRLGYGLRLWEAGMRSLGRRTVGLDGVVAQQANYARSGFVLAHRNIRFGGTGRGQATGTAPVSSIDATLIDPVIAYDRQFFPQDRAAFLRSWLAPGSRKSFAVVADGELRGYAVLRACREGFKVGPLFADTVPVAEMLLGAAAAGAGGAPIFIDVPEPNATALALVARFGLAPVFETARMYRGQAPALPLQAIYGITTLELG